jgi:adenine-specific DNA-methyltransferase
MMDTLSTKLTKILTSDVKRSQGIYFTPTKDVAFLVEKMLKITNNIKTVLEPSCGSCEFVRYLDKRLSGLNMDCYETNPDIYRRIKQIQFRNNVAIYDTDFLQTSLDKKYDLIIGNPPFFETNQYPKNVFFNTKVNIYLLFIIHSLKKLNRTGYLLFVLPSNFLTNMYCDNLRRHIVEFYNIHMIHLFEGSKYIDTTQETCALLLRRYVQSKPKRNPFVFVLPDRVVFNGHNQIKRIRSLISEGTTLKTLGFDVSVGTVLWNENKSYLTNDSSHPRLVYNTDIDANKLVEKSYKNSSKRNYIRKKGVDDLVIVVNRGYGSGKYEFNFALIQHKNYLVENHLLVIRHRTLRNRATIKKQLLIVYNSFKDHRTKEFISLYFKNNAISTQELATILPIFTSH